MTTYITVAIPYVNADPHLGYAYELVLADVAARARRRRGDRVRFLGGTDDFSLKNVLAAEAAGADTATFVAERSARFAALRDPLALSFDDFIHTSTDRRHAPAVERLWRAAAARGDLYRKDYEGLYCVGCEQFYGEDELVGGGCAEHGLRLERVAEVNWFFRLARYQDQVEELISSGRLAVEPKPFRDEVLSFVRRGLTDISVSRSVERARGWGIGVPDDPTQVIYVWFDALVNYISALGFGDGDSPAYRRWWRESGERVHVVGKGILRFHAVYWPAFLLSAGEPLPTRIQVHPYLTVDGRKLSKSAGAELPSPAAAVDLIGTDALRWWFVRDVGAVADTDFTFERAVARANEDLANGLGNVVNRIVTLVQRFCGGTVDGGEVLPAVGDIETEVLDLLSSFDLRAAAHAVVDAVAALNRDIEATRPWELARSAADDPLAADALRTLLGRYVATARAIAAAVEPIVPNLSARLTAQLTTGVPTPAFRRLDPPPPPGL